MSIINFPSNPTVNQVYNFAGRSWIWTGRSWRSISTFVGYTGSRGLTGFTGSKGDLGFTGSQGDQGFTGSQGIPGEFAGVGFTGSRGFTGSQGAGFTGSQGEIGFTGSQGIPGEAANIGFTGSSAPGHINLYQSGVLVLTEGTTRWYAPYNLVVTAIIPRVVIAANNDIKIDVKKNGTSFIELTIPANEFNGPSYLEEFSLLFGDFLTVAVTQVGTSAAPGAELYVQFQFRFA
jgi:hypothetical protein